MKDRRIVRWIECKFLGLANELSERTRRRWVAVEAVSLGHGGIAAVSAATGVAPSTIRRGIRELAGGPSAPADRERRAGAGRKRVTVVDPGIRAALERLVEPDTRGDPQSPLRWTCKSTYHLAAALQQQGHAISQRTVYRLLDTLGYSLQSNRKTAEGADHADRDAQFRHGLGLRRRLHAMRGAQEQRIIELLTKPVQRVAHRRLGQAKPVGGP